MQFKHHKQDEKDLRLLPESMERYNKKLEWNHRTLC